MSKRRKIIVLASVTILSFLIMFGIGFYLIYDYGKKNGLLEEKLPINKEEYTKKKETIEEREQRIELEEDDLEKKYINKEITYEEYKIKKREIELEEDELSEQEERLEKEYGVDD